MEAIESPQIRRSISMPVKPRPLEPKSLQRSEEKETVFESVDYYPESPELERRHKWDLDNHMSRSANDVPYSNDWVGSTIELNAEAHRSSIAELDNTRRRPHRVIEKNGHENVTFRRIPQKSWRYIRDFVTTVVRTICGLMPKKSLTPTPSNLTTTITPCPTKQSLTQSDITNAYDECERTRVLTEECVSGSDSNNRTPVAFNQSR